nr:hypothetical protein CFP56_24442 [Quercus suber]
MGFRNGGGLVHLVLAMLSEVGAVVASASSPRRPGGRNEGSAYAFHVSHFTCRSRGMVIDLQAMSRPSREHLADTYLQKPAIAGIIVATLIVLSLLLCLFRCLCCGAECCCGCLSCCNACCPSPRRSRHGGYQQQPQPYYQPPQPYQQYHPQPAPVYASGGASGYRSAPRTATFDAPSPNKNFGGSTCNEDALPAMPGWDSAPTRRIEEEDVELEKLQHPQAAQQQALLPRSHDGAQYEGGYYGQQGNDTGDIGAMYASPYAEHEYSQHQQYAPSFTESSRSTAYPPTYHSNAYEPQFQQQQSHQQGYAASIPPSYHTAAFNPVSPIGRKPVQGSWRDV